MKKYSLSSAAERITIIGIFVFMITLFSTLIVFLYSTAAMPMLVGAAIFILALYELTYSLYWPPPVKSVRKPGRPPFTVFAKLI